jgi:DNA-binding NtrC family response regulator
MNKPVTLLLTNDPELEDSVAHALRQSAGLSHLAHSASDALQIVCGVGQDLDLAMIDFESGPHGMTLLSAIIACREDLPVIVVTHDDEKHVEALAYANGATACLPKPVSAAQLINAMERCRGFQHQLAFVD